MKRKALLMGMAVVTSLPGTLLAKGTGRQTDEVHSYTGGWDGAYSLPVQRQMAEGPATRSAEILASLKSLMTGANQRTAEGHDYDPKGWQLGLLEAQPAMTDEDAPGLRQDMRLGLSFRFSF